VRTVLALCLLGSSALASPIGGATPVRKPPPDGLSPDNTDDFIRGIAEDKQGKYTDAEHSYERVIYRDSKNAASYYNLGDLYRRLELTPKAIEAYEKYLANAPDASDKAQVEKLVAKLKAAPANVVIDGRTPNGIVFLDGKRIGASPWVGGVTAGEHRADRLTATTYGTSTFTTKNATNVHEDVSDREAKGNVLITGSPDLYGSSWKDGDTEYSLHDRFTLKPGKYSTFLVRKDFACTALTFEVAKAPALTYVYVTIAPKQDKCVPITVKTQTITFKDPS
jgi:tetratricopeptide (TPR) repeat protein